MAVDRFDISGTDARLIDQYAESSDLKALLHSLIDGPSRDLRDVFTALKKRLDIDEMRGANLDRIGDIIGRPRPLALDFAEDGTAFEFSGLTGTSGAPLTFDSDPLEFNGDPIVVMAVTVGPSDPVKAFSSLGNPDQGGRFVGLTTNAFMGDQDYRVLLKAQIYANTTAATVEDIERYGETILGTPVTVVNTNIAISVQIAGRVSPVLRGVVKDTLEAAAGVRIDSISFGAAAAADAFTFDGPSGTGFGAIGQPEVGSGFVRLL